VNVHIGIPLAPAENGRANLFDWMLPREWNLRQRAPAREGT